MYMYTVEYLNDKYDRVRDYVLAENDEECMNKFKAHHSDDEGFIVNWQAIDY